MNAPNGHIAGNVVVNSQLVWTTSRVRAVREDRALSAEDAVREVGCARGRLRSVQGPVPALRNA